ncbi:MAG TPA: NAD(P)H-hydrate epimerase, partial [candidate division Zixibacteria bacterium]|nr:NAD(P)H-hydrate epimerase [candidate division Zixibacteria bacterium]
MKLVTADLMRRIDQETIERVGIPGPQLMENAGRGIAERILSDVLESPGGVRIAVFCGKGNNGGDGFVVARYLHEAGADISIYYLGPKDKLSPDARLNFDHAVKLKLPVIEVKAIAELPDELDADYIIDAIFGTGFEGAPRGLSGELIDYMNDQMLPIIAIDLPSGLNADRGTHEGAVADADFTFSLALPKFGLYVSPGRELAGTVGVVPIGIPDETIDKFQLGTELITPELVSELLPERPADAHKGVFGKVFILAGSQGLTGA